MKIQRIVGSAALTYGHPVMVFRFFRKVSRAWSAAWYLHPETRVDFNGVVTGKYDVAPWEGRWHYYIRVSETKFDVPEREWRTVSEGDEVVVSMSERASSDEILEHMILRLYYSEPFSPGLGAKISISKGTSSQALQLSDIERQKRELIEEDDD